VNELRGNEREFMSLRHRKFKCERKLRPIQLQFDALINMATHKKHKKKVRKNSKLMNLNMKSVLKWKHRKWLMMLDMAESTWKTLIKFN
jgi:hypothetical protein